MLPENEIETVESYVRKPSKTLKIDFDNNKVEGEIDGIESVKQAIRIALMTQRYKYVIFSHSYGTDYKNAFSEGYMRAMGKVKNAIYESLMCDDRILGVDSFEFERLKNKMMVKFNVYTIFGKTEYEGEVEN